MAPKEMAPYEERAPKEMARHGRDSSLGRVGSYDGKRPSSYPKPIILFPNGLIQVSRPG